MRRFTLFIFFFLFLSNPVLAGRLKNAGDIIDEVQRRLFRDPNTINSTDIYSGIQCFVWLNSAMLDLAMQLPVEVMPELTTINTADVVDSQADYALPNDTTTGVFLRFMACEAYLVVSSTPIPTRYWCTEIPIEKVRETELIAAYVPLLTNPYCYIFNDSVWFIRDSTGSTPSVASTAQNNEGIKLYYIREPKEVTLDADVPEFEKTFYDLLVTGILRRAYEKNKDWSAVKAMQELWDLSIAKHNLMYREVEKK